MQKGIDDNDLFPKDEYFFGNKGNIFGKKYTILCKREEYLQV